MAAALPLLGAVGAAAQPAKEPRAAVDCAAFRREPTGAWTALRPVTIAPDGTPIQVPSGQTFDPDMPYEGLDVAAWLEGKCGNSQP